MDITIDAVTFAVWWGGVSVVIVSFIEEINFRAPQLIAVTSE
jgi:hypothetical protein